jgi:hypothetical protein
MNIYIYIYIYESHEHGKHGDLVSKGYLQYKKCDKNLKMLKFASFCRFFLSKKDKITIFQNALDQPPSVQVFFRACLQNSLGVLFQDLPLKVFENHLL